MQKSKPLILIDRDGTIIREDGYPKDPRRVRLMAGAVRGLKRLRRAGYRLVVVTNQSGVGRGLITVREMQAVKKRILSLLRQQGVRLNGYYECLHAPEAHCRCRKPELGLVKRAARDLGVSWRGAISIGDRPSDVMLGFNTGGWGILVRTGYGRRALEMRLAVRPDRVVRNLDAAAAWILRHHPTGKDLTR